MEINNRAIKVRCQRAFLKKFTPMEIVSPRDIEPVESIPLLTSCASPFELWTNGL